jgi:hypothetical protein
LNNIVKGADRYMRVKIVIARDWFFTDVLNGACEKLYYGRKLSWAFRKNKEKKAHARCQPALVENAR